MLRITDDAQTLACFKAIRAALRAREILWADAR